MNPIEMTTENSPAPAHVYRGVCADLNLSVLNSIYWSYRARAVARWTMLEMWDGRPTYYAFDPGHPPLLEDSRSEPAKEAAALDIPVTGAGQTPGSPCVSWADDLAEARARANTKGLQNGLLLSAGIATLVIAAFVAGLMLGVRVGGLMH